jgi:predicted O-linked N-acetylglucosamine transferase (SPINDLY family)
MDPRHADAMLLLGVITHQVGRNDLAIDLIGKAIDINGAVAIYHYDRGIVLNELGRLDDAIAAYDASIRINPDFPEVHNNRGNVLKDLGRLDDAIAAYDAAIRVKPDYAEAHSNRGNTLRDVGRLADAIAAYDSAIRIKPDSAEAHFNLGNALKDLGRPDDAIAAYDASIRIEPDFAEVHNNRGNVLKDLGRPDDAIAAYDAAIRIKPDHANANSQLIHCLQHICAWNGLTQRQHELLRLIPHRCEDISPFVILALDSTAEQQRACANSWIEKQCRDIVPLGRRPRHPDAKTRLGYLSADFHEHVMAYLVAELFERHDRTRFEVAGYSYGPDDGSAMRRRLASTFDRFADLRDLSDAEAARRIYDDGVDILVDLMGYTRNCRPRILAFRPASLQVNFLGYPGTMGADFIDYIIADPICVPIGDEDFFSEKVVRLPDCYQPNGSRRAIAMETPSREACGLPGQGFVFCCFNNSYKITPAVFEVWMRLLDKVPGSVLWLLEANVSAKDNLRREAALAAIASERLVFAPRRPPPEHLARHRLADLFLDTLPYNAHTTTSDALWAGLPVLTCLGRTFAGRVAASLLSAVGMEELITSSLAEYEALALALATDTVRLTSLKEKLAANSRTAPLFDGERFARNLEAEFLQMLENPDAAGPGLIPSGGSDGDMQCSQDRLDSVGPSWLGGEGQLPGQQTIDYKELLIGCGSRRNKDLVVNGRSSWSNLTTCDINPNHAPDILWDLTKLPLPFRENEFDEIHAYEILEHTGCQGDYKFFFEQFTEFWRILKPGGFLLGSVPDIGSPWVWGDPSHTRVIQKENLLFLEQDIYTREVGVTKISDFRYLYQGDFQITYCETKDKTLYFVLKAVKPSRITGAFASTGSA